MWIKKLRQRLTDPLSDLPVLDIQLMIFCFWKIFYNNSRIIHRIFKGDNAELVLKRKDDQLRRMLDLEGNILNGWRLSVKTCIPENLKKFILKRCKDELLTVNFDSNVR